MNYSVILTTISLVATFLSGATKAHGDDHHGNFLHDSNKMHDKKQIMDQLDDVAKVDEKDMTDDQLDFYYFELHDKDRDGRLDGLELFKAILEYVPINRSFKDLDFKGLSSEEISKKQKEHLNKQYDSLEEQVHHILEDEDENKDGYVSYAEFKAARTHVA